MGAYRIFDGITWIDPCVCNVHVRGVAGWQLLDPVNCPVKYWDGNSWCDIICQNPDECIIYSNIIQEYPVIILNFYCSGSPIGYYAFSMPMYNITEVVDDLNLSNIWGDYSDNGDGRVKMVVSPQILAESGCLCENLTMEISSNV